MKIIESSSLSAYLADLAETVNSICLLRHMFIDKHVLSNTVLDCQEEQVPYCEYLRNCYIHCFMWPAPIG